MQLLKQAMVALFLLIGNCVWASIIHHSAARQSGIYNQARQSVHDHKRRSMVSVTNVNMDKLVEGRKTVFDPDSEISTSKSLGSSMHARVTVTDPNSEINIIRSISSTIASNRSQLGKEGKSVSFATDPKINISRTLGSAMRLKMDRLDRRTVCHLDSEINKIRSIESAKCTNRTNLFGETMNSITESAWLGRCYIAGLEKGFQMRIDTQNIPVGSISYAIHKANEKELLQFAQKTREEYIARSLELQINLFLGAKLSDDPDKFINKIYSLFLISDESPLKAKLGEVLKNIISESRKDDNNRISTAIESIVNQQASTTSKTSVKSGFMKVIDSIKNKMLAPRADITDKNRNQLDSCIQSCPWINKVMHSKSKGQNNIHINRKINDDVIKKFILELVNDLAELELHIKVSTSNRSRSNSPVNSSSTRSYRLGQ